MERHVGAEMRRLQNEIFRTLQEQVGKIELSGVGVMNISGPNTFLLKVLSMHKGEDVFQRDLEKALSVTKSTCSKVLTTLEEKGLVRREPVEDARFNKIVLTPLGAEFVEKSDAVIGAMEERLTAGFSEEERRQLFSFFDRLRENLQS